MQQSVPTVNHIERVLFVSAGGDVGDLEADLLPHFQLTVGLIFQSQRDHVSGEVNTPHLDVVISGHVKSRAARSATDIQYLLSRLKI